MTVTWSNHAYATLWRLAPAFTGELRPQPFSLPLALASLSDLGLDNVDPDPGTDRRLYGLSDPAFALLARLCLRCRASAEAKAKLEVLWRKCSDILSRSTQDADPAVPDLADMASFILDDVGALDPDGPAEKQPYVPFLLSMLRGWDPERATLPTWTRVAIDGHAPLKRYLRSFRIDFISPWAALAHRVTDHSIQAAWSDYADLGMTPDEAQRLLQAFQQAYATAKLHYRNRTGRRTGWLPDPSFFKQVDPTSKPEDTEARLRGIVRMVRNLKVGPPLRSLDRDASADKSDAALDPLERALRVDERQQERFRQDALWAEMQRVRDEAIRFPPSYKPAAQRLRENGGRFLCVCRGQAAGRSIAGDATDLQRNQRQMACDCDTSQPTVNRDLEHLRQWAQEIAVVAAGRLGGAPGFESLGSSEATIDRLIATLAHSLLVPLRLGEEAPLCKAIDLHLQTR